MVESPLAEVALGWMKRLDTATSFCVEAGEIAHLPAKVTWLLLLSKPKLRVSSHVATIQKKGSSATSRSKRSGLHTMPVHL